MTGEEMKALVRTLTVAGINVLARGIDAGLSLAEGTHVDRVDAGLARMIEALSDERASRKKFPDGTYQPPPR